MRAMNNIKYLYIFGIKILLMCFIHLSILENTFADSGSEKVKSLLNKFGYVSPPTRNFLTPTGNILRSLEVMISAGSSFGIEESGSLLGKTAIGLGGIAEVQLTRSSFMNNLTGEQADVPTSVFKMSLIPEQFTQLWYIPNLSLQIHSTPWNSSVTMNSSLRSAVTEVHDYKNTTNMNIDNRFTTLYGIIGKDYKYVGIHGGISVTDIRIRNGYQWIYDQNLGYNTIHEIDDMQKNLVAPFGNVTIFANEDTRLMADIQSTPLIDYDVKNRKIRVKQTWLAIVGIRFFITSWISLDTGVSYFSSAKGIADSEVNVGLNFILPFKNMFNKQQ